MNAVCRTQNIAIPWEFGVPSICISQWVSMRKWQPSPKKRLSSMGLNHRMITKNPLIFWIQGCHRWNSKTVCIFNSFQVVSIFLPSHSRDQTYLGGCWPILRSEWSWVCTPIYCRLVCHTRNNASMWDLLLLAWLVFHERCTRKESGFLGCMQC